MVATRRVFDGKINIFPKVIISNLDEFNEKFNTSFTQDSFADDIIEYLRKTYNKLACCDHSYNKQNTKQWFNETFKSYAIVHDL